MTLWSLPREGGSHGGERLCVWGWEALGLPFQPQERLAPIFKRFAVLCTRHGICGRGHCLWATRDRAVGEGGGAGAGGGGG